MKTPLHSFWLTDLMSFTLNLRKMDQHTGEKWLINGTKHHKENHSQSMEDTSNYILECKPDIKKVPRTRTSLLCTFMYSRELTLYTLDIHWLWISIMYVTFQGHMSMHYILHFAVANKWCNGTHCVWNILSLQWRHNERDGISNHQPHECLLNRLFGRRSRKTSKLRVTGLCVGPVTRKMFPFDDVIMLENSLGSDLLIFQYIFVIKYRQTLLRVSSLSMAIPLITGAALKIHVMWSVLCLEVYFSKKSDWTVLQRIPATIFVNKIFLDYHEFRRRLTHFHYTPLKSHSN